MTTDEDGACCMLTRLSEYLYSKATGQSALIACALLVLFYGLTLPLQAIVFPAGDALISLDDPVNYSAEQVLKIVDGWGADGRTYQFWFHLTWDLAAPLLSFVFLAQGLSLLLRGGFEPQNRWRHLNLAALAPVFDLLENVILIGLIVAHPAQPTTLAWLKSVITMCKYAAGVPLSIVAAVGICMALKNRISER